MFKGSPNLSTNLSSHLQRWNRSYIYRNYHPDNILGEPFGHLQHKLWSKEGSGVKLAVWLPTTKNQESNWSRCVQVECHTLLKIFRGKLQVCFRPHPNRRFELGVMTSQSLESPNRDSFGTPP
jgi:hypothetical protein